MKMPNCLELALFIRQPIAAGDDPQTAKWGVCQMTHTVSQ